MPDKISKRLVTVVDAIPLGEGMRVLEIGCGPGVAAREIASRYDDIYVLGIDRSAKAIEQAVDSSTFLIEQGKLAFLQMSIEDFEWKQKEKFDIAFAIRVGALDGRHPELYDTSILRIKTALKKNGRLFTDGANPLKEIKLT